MKIEFAMSQLFRMPLEYMCVRTDYQSNLFPLLGIFKQTMIHKKLGMDKDYLATKAIPFLFPLAVEPGLNLSQVTVVTYLPDSRILSNTALIFSHYGKRRGKSNIV